MTPSELAALGGHSQQHQELLLWVALGLFAGVIFAILVVYRRSADRLEMEEIDALLREEEVL